LYNTEEYQPSVINWVRVFGFDGDPPLIVDPHRVISKLANEIMDSSTTQNKEEESISQDQTESQGQETDDSQEEVQIESDTDSFENIESQ